MKTISLNQALDVFVRIRNFCATQFYKKNGFARNFFFAQSANRSHHPLDLATDMHFFATAIDVSTTKKWSRHDNVRSAVERVD